MPVSFLENHHLVLAEKAAKDFASFEPHENGPDDNECARLLANSGYYQYLVPKVDVRSVCVIREAMAYRNAACDSIFAVQGLGSHPIVLAGTEKQKQELLPQVASGQALFAFALTEPEAGSDVASLSTTATLDKGEYVLNGQKRFISNAGVATHYTVFARTGPGTRGISAFGVPQNTPGFRVVRPMALLGEHPIGELAFENCRIPAANRIGEEGAGLKLALSTLDVFRTTVGAAAVGMAQRALDEALFYTQNRRQFGAPLSELSAVQAMLADSAVELEASRLLVHKAAATKDAGAERVTYEAAVAKLYATEAAQRIIDKALQVHGGNGVVKGFAVERLYRDVRALRIYEGASEVQRLVIARHLLTNAKEHKKP